MARLLKPPRGPAHLSAVDLVRFVTVAGVISVHCTSLTASRSSVAAGGVLDVLHVTRSIFLFLSAFVLGYSFRRRPLDARAFWAHRYSLVVPAYVVWSAIYWLTDGNLRSPGYALSHFGLDLLDAGAHFQLYFLLLIFQLYLVFPWLIRAFALHPRSHAPALVGSAAFELAFTAAVHYGWRPPLLAIWLDHPGSWLPSYPLYVVGGVLMAIHFEEVTSWVRSHGRLIVAGFSVSLVLVIASYLADQWWLGADVVAASAVFQPTNVVEAVAAILALYALGLRVVVRLGERGRKFLERSWYVSFGIYLSHPLLVGGILDVARLSGLSAAVATLPSGLIEAMAVFGLMPFVYATTFVAMDHLRHTRLSRVMTGRPRFTRPGTTIPVPAPPRVRP